jgi:hypothetical protein
MCWRNLTNIPHLVNGNDLNVLYHLSTRKNIFPTATQDFHNHISEHGQGKDERFQNFVKYQCKYVMYYSDSEVRN